MLRPFSFVFAGLVALSAGLGCQHVAGKCDCTAPTQPCCKYGLYTGADCADPNPAPAATAKPGCGCGSTNNGAIVAPAPVYSGTPVVVPGPQAIQMPREGL